MLLSTRRFAPALHVLAYCALGGMVGLAVFLRIALYPVETSDYTLFVSQWYDFIQTHGGFAALKYDFSNYNISYLFLLTLATYLPISKLIAIKTLSVLFDGGMGLFAYLILSLRYRRSYAALAGALVLLLAPTIFINSAAWGQADAMYAAFCLGSLYFLLKQRPTWACVFFGLALSFKLQAIFFFPVLLMLLLRRRLPIKSLVFIPVIFLLTLTPAFIAGRDAGSVLTIYAEQVASGGVGGAGQFTGSFNGLSNGQNNNRFNGGGSGPFNGSNLGQFNGGGPGQFNGTGPGGIDFSSSSLTFNAPSFYQWLPASTPDSWKWVGIALAALVVGGIGLLLLKSKQHMTPAILLKLALVFALAIPFLLPEMHERYFFLADVVSIIYAFYFPRSCYIAIIMQLCSLLSYAPYFLNTQIISLSYVASAVFAITVVALLDLVMTLYPGLWKRQTLTE